MNLPPPALAQSLLFQGDLLQVGYSELCLVLVYTLKLNVHKEIQEPSTGRRQYLKLIFSLKCSFLCSPSLPISPPNHLFQSSVFAFTHLFSHLISPCLPSLSLWYGLFHKCGLDLDSSQSVASNLLL